MRINFFVEEISFKLKKPTALRKWIKEVINQENKRLAELNYIFCSDTYLLDLNKQYLQHDTLTDIITFDRSEEKDRIEGDIYISIDRVLENAKELQLPFENELHRVMVHGVLHLCGFADKSTQQKEAMRKKEDHCLSLLQA